MSEHPWSFSKLKAFEQCPKQFYFVNVVKQYPFEETDAIRYGTEYHLAAEEYIRDNKQLPDKFGWSKPVLDALNNKRGVKHCEQKLGVTRDFQPCSFFAKNVWFRGVADLIIIDGDLAWVIDYKTGKSAKYADKGQLELMSLAVFAHYPEVKRVRAGLLFVISNNLIKENYVESQRESLWDKWIAKYNVMSSAFESDTWNPKPSGLCKRHCPVTECPHNGGNQ